jgi:hypothetical protein
MTCLSPLTRHLVTLSQLDTLIRVRDTEDPTGGATVPKEGQDLSPSWPLSTEQPLLFIQVSGQLKHHPLLLMSCPLCSHLCCLGVTCCSQSWGILLDKGKRELPLTYDILHSVTEVLTSSITHS